MCLNKQDPNVFPLLTAWEVLQDHFVCKSYYRNYFFCILAYPWVRREDCKYFEVFNSFYYKLCSILIAACKVLVYLGVTCHICITFNV